MFLASVPPFSFPVAPSCRLHRSLRYCLSLSAMPTKSPTTQLYPASQPSPLAVPPPSSPTWTCWPHTSSARATERSCCRWRGGSRPRWQVRRGRPNPGQDVGLLHWFTHMLPKQCSPALRATQSGHAVPCCAVHCAFSGLSARPTLTVTSGWPLAGACRAGGGYQVGQKGLARQSRSHALPPPLHLHCSRR